MDFQGKVAIVTGGAQGIGFAFCEKLLQEGTKVCVCDININGSELKALSTTYKDGIILHKCDVSSVDSFKEAFERTKQTFGKIDLVVNNAGVISETNWRKCVDVNLIGTIHGIHLGLEYMGKDKGNSGGYIVNIGSLIVFETNPLTPIYNGTKYAIVGLTKTYGTDYFYKKTGVKVGCVCPGSVDTPLFYKYPDLSIDPEEAKKGLVSRPTVPPEFLADGLVKLLNDGRNGAVLRVQAEFVKYVE